MNMQLKEEVQDPQLMQGNLFCDDRGEMGFVNDFNFLEVKRFYSISNYKAGFIRAWHAHKNESKYVTVVSGCALVAVVKIDNWENPAKDLKVHRFILSAHKPAVLFIPAGFANGFMNFEKDTRMLFFSTSSIEESREDDVRYDAYYWNPWQIVER